MASSKMPKGSPKQEYIRPSFPVSKIQAVVRQIRELVNSDSQPTLSSQQAKSVKRRRPRDTEWTRRFVLPAPKEDDVLSVLLQAIKELGDGGEDFHYQVSSLSM